MDRGAGAALRKRALSVDTASAAAAIEPESKGEEAGAVAAEEEEPVSPTGRLFREPSFNCHIVAVFGLAAPVDLPALRAGVAATLARHPRFCSVQVLNEFEKDARPKWVRSAVNLDNHVIVPDLDPAATSAHPDRALEDYVSSLSTRPMDHSVPLWELHVLDFPTAEATATVAPCISPGGTPESGVRILDLNAAKLFGIKAAAALCYGMFTHTTLSFSNMVGPTEQVLFCGNPIVYIAPGTYGHPHALTIHYQSYVNTVKLVLSVDESQFPDCHLLLDDFAESLRLVREAASRKSEEAWDGTPS